MNKIRHIRTSVSIIIFNLYYLSKLILSSSTTRGLFIALLLILRIYSPVRPMKNSWTPHRKHIAIIIAAVPVVKNYAGFIILSIIQTSAATKLINERNIPPKVASLGPILVYEVNESIAAS